MRRTSSILLGLLASLLACAVSLCPTARADGIVPGDEHPRNYFRSFARGAFPEGAVETPRAGQPIVMVVIDALRPDHLGCYGYLRKTSPTLDRFANEGVVFTRYLANAPWTKAATASMLTGRIAAEHRTQGHQDKLPADVGTFAQQLKQAGYTTLAVVGNGNASSAFGLHKGFDVFEDTTGNWKGLPDARQVFQKGLKLLERHRKKDKVFLLLFVVDPHVPYNPKPPYDEMFMPGYSGTVITHPRWEFNNKYSRSARKKMIANYDGLIRYTDDQLKSLFKGLKRLGFYDRATIVVTADHGEGLGEHGIYRHGHHHYETHLRIPLVIRAPWIKPEGRGKYSSAFLQQLDLFPTYCAIAGAPVPDGLMGFSIVDALESRANLPHPRYVISEYRCYGIHRAAIRTRRFKLIYQEPADEEMYMKHVRKKELLPSVDFENEVFHLFDVHADPRETTNLWPTLEHKVGRKLLRVLKEEIDTDAKRVKAKKIDPALVEELRSMGYVE